MNKPLLEAIRTVSAAFILLAFALIHLGVVLPVWWSGCPTVGTLNKNVEFVAATFNGFVLAVVAALCGVRVEAKAPEARTTALGRLRGLFVFEKPIDWASLIRVWYVWVYLGCGAVSLATVLFEPDAPGLVANLAWGALAFVLAMSRAFFPELEPKPNDPATPNS